MHEVAIVLDVDCTNCSLTTELNCNCELSTFFAYFCST